ncbi:MAG: FGGY family carbohydrate kinase [Micrococcales bacterium]
MTNTNNLILAIDQGTGSTKGLLVTENLEVFAQHSENIDIESPQSGWVQQDANQIWESVAKNIDALVAKGQGNIAGLAITNQRESAVAWDKQTGEPIGPMLGWQDRRTAGRLDDLTAVQKTRIREITGLPLDPMFSALKLEWLLDQYDADRSRSKAGEIALGTVDAWLVYKLTGQHRVELGNASRTQLLDIHSSDWSDELLGLFNIPKAALPELVASDSASTEITSTSAKGLRVLSVLADSHAALFAHGSNIKATFGTGSSIMALTKNPVEAPGLVQTVAWADRNGTVTALEGNILSSGATVVWLAELLGSTPAELASLAVTAKATNVNLVPAFGGLGAPWWDADAQGVVTGLTLAASRAELARAAFESIVLQIEDVIAAVESATGERIEQVNVDGGPTANEWLMQLMADYSQRIIVKNDIPELSAIGVAKFANQSKASAHTTTYSPKISVSEANARKASWHEAVTTSRMQRSN